MMTDDERRERNAERQRRVRAEAGLVSDPVPMPVWPEAACRGSDLDFFPRRGDLWAEADAIEVCHRCPHRTECLEWAIDHDECGIWGGTTERTRRRVTGFSGTGTQ